MSGVEIIIGAVVLVSLGYALGLAVGYAVGESDGEAKVIREVTAVAMREREAAK